MMKILVSDKIDASFIEAFENYEKAEVDYLPGLERTELKEKIKNYDALVVRSSTKVDLELIVNANNLKLIARAGTGVDNIDIEAATRKGIFVINTPGGNTISAAEHTLSLMLSLCRHIPQANATLKEKKWDRKTYVGTELQGKTLGVLGLGKIGREVSLRASSFGMNILGYDPVISNETAKQVGAKLVSFNELIENSDIITLHLPFNEDTKYIISSEALNKCKDGVKIINCARGGLVNEKDIIEYLNNGKVSGAAFDVYEEEPTNNYELINHPKVVATPHLGASTSEAQEKIANQLVEQMKEWVEEGTINFAVNTNVSSAIQDEKLKPFLKLCERIGEMNLQILKENIKEVKLKYSGSFLHPYSNALTAAFLKGLLKKLMSGAINYVNAPIIAKELGLKVEENLSFNSGLYTSLVTSDLQTAKTNLTISGTVILNNNLKIVQINDYGLEVTPEGNLLIYYNVDKPGVLSKVSSLLAKENINIAGLSLSRTEKGLQALTVINLDERPEDDIIKKIGGLEDINEYFVLSIDGSN